MKTIKDLDIRKEAKPDRQYTDGQNDAVKSFILSIYSLYSTNKIGDAKDPKNIIVKMRVYADDILRMTGSRRQERIAKTKRLMQAGHENYQWPEDALGRSCAEHQFFIHDYHQYYPPRADALGVRDGKLKIEVKPTDREQAKKNAQRLKDLF
ncbi:MAG: hypothetical protein V3V84_07795 [Candidatus Bathyarchaeia archaeon]